MISEKSIVLIQRKDFDIQVWESEHYKCFWLKFTINYSILHLSFNFIGQVMPKIMYNLRGD